MTLSLREKNAIAYVAAKSGYRLTLCVKPWVHYSYKGVPVQIRLKQVLEEYDNDRKKEARANRRYSLFPFRKIS